ncbi:MAG: hypothetical protein SPI21_25480 [Hungatella hathewayi]|uniref:hypothetical protein n=1 Tax=Hungatella TaxID=1649459 RepID=UPI0011066EE4|nr:MULTISPECIES: hypothetical protein [Hungatella]MCI7379947.1 hypothetical protein [Hungatella sp.]MDY6240131.1 hypothetical protein [Hungatella hathewayi]
MKYITEADLRDLYRTTPFTTYETEPGTRLTPGARQFLGDRGIRVPDEYISPKKFRDNGTSETALNETAAGKKKLQNRLKSARALFLETGLQFKEHDVLLAQRIFVMERCLAGLSEEAETCLLPCQACSGIGPDNFSEEMEDCFEITAFHVQSDRGLDLIRLHRLRCLLRELGPYVEQELGDGKKRELHQVINGLSQLICQLFGGNTCQKKE